MTRRKRARARRARNAWWRQYRRHFFAVWPGATPETIAWERRMWTPEAYAQTWMSQRGREARRLMRDAARVSRGAR